MAHTERLQQPGKMREKHVQTSINHRSFPPCVFPPATMLTNFNDKEGRNKEMASQPKVVRYAMMDVFTKEPFMGNPLAVILDGEPLSQAEMLRIAKWMNLSETTFVVPVTSTGTADYRVRIFDPIKELMFAGHPTLGTCAALVASGAVKARSDGTVLQECGVGIVPVVVGNDMERPFEFRAPAVREPVQLLPQADFLAVFASSSTTSLSVLTCPVVMNLGIRWGLIFFGDHNALLDLKIAGDEFARFCETHNLDGVTAVAAASTEKQRTTTATAFDIELRTFFPSGNNTFAEDPVCGSANACVARFLALRGEELPGFANLVQQRGYVARQGSALGREGRVFVTYRQNVSDGDSGGNAHISDPWIGGFVCGVVQGTIRLS